LIDIQIQKLKRVASNFAVKQMAQTKLSAQYRCVIKKY